MAGGGGGVSRGWRKKARIEIIPLIDIMFFLLATFVMVSLSMVKNEGVSVMLPGASTSDAKEKDDSITTVSVAEGGDVYINQEKITMSQLPLRLSSIKASNPDPKFTLNADSRANFDKVVLVLDEIRKLGVTKIGISTKTRQ